MRGLKCEVGGGEPKAGLQIRVRFIYMY
jgi:hypothetical protein